jgi:ribosome-binding protein aMBF1 (putative translation factor)
MANDRKAPVRLTAARRKRLRRAGWTVGSPADFLRLSQEEQAIVEMRLALSTALRDRRRVLGLSQVTLAKRLGSSQSRVAKMEAADPSVSLGLLVRTLLATGVTRRGLGRAIAA